ncbi:MAG: exosortase/archaeosortase family protein [Verrucomicrobiae bacterium]|nr:exosortase/archaeosortase family protein [Verrucomicrobiae bacterium]
MSAIASHLRRWNGAGWVAAVAGSWLWSWWRLAGEWRLAENYRYGFSVPLLLAALVWIRLPDRNDPPLRPAPRASRGLLLVGLVFFFAAELVREMDPLWRIVHGFFAAAATCLTLAWLDRLGGVALRRRMAFPLAFAWTALPWPMGLEAPVGNFLMSRIALAAADALNLAGVAALRQGNLLVLKNGVLGVDVACSGIQSLQAGLMIALFLGDFLALSRRRRGALLAFSVACAMAGNFARALALAWILGVQGAAVEARRHDLVGAAATAAIFGLIAGAAWGLRPRGARRDGPCALPSARRAFAASGRAGLAVAALLLASPFLARGWFALRGEALRVQMQPLWETAVRPIPSGWTLRENPLPPSTLGMLMCSSGRSLSLRTDDALPAEVTHLFWKPGNFMPSLGYSHTPEICMPSAGWELLEGPTPASFAIGGKSALGALYLFRLEGRRIAVFHAVWHGGAPRAVRPWPMALAGRLDRLRQLWEGRRDRGHETLTIALPALSSAAATRAAMERVLDAIVTPNSALPPRPPSAERGRAVRTPVPLVVAECFRGFPASVSKPLRQGWPP